MYQSHPFRSGVRSIVESAPPASLRAPVVGLRIGPDRATHRARAKLSELETLLESVKPGAVRLLEIDPASQLTRVPLAVERFTELTHAHVAGRKLRDFSALGGLAKIESLFITGYREPEFWPMQELPLERVRSIGDSLVSCALSSKQLWFQRSKLQRFEHGSVEELRLENCNSVDYTSLRNLVGLQRLVLMAQPLTSLDFLADCRELRSLDVFAPSKKTDVQQLARTTTLERVFLAADAKVIEAIGKANPRLSITNGETCFIGGQPAKHFGDFHPTAVA